MLKPLHTVLGLSDRAYQSIKEGILTLQIKPGQSIPIGDLASQLGVSRTPVRDALFRLEKEGLVTIHPRKGAFATLISAQDVLEIFELRVILEGYAARTAAERLTSEDFSRLDDLLAQSETAFRVGDEIGAADLGRKLHDVLVATVGNRRLASYLEDLDDYYTRIRRFALTLPGRFETSHEQHKEIVAALRNHSGDLAGQIMAGHLESVRDEVLVHIDTWIPSLKNTEDGRGTGPTRE